ncbi:MAG: glycoside hydrolase family 88 protein [Bacteroidota bacterium]|nr:glycoside hydrolase family 88 protein [Bacteroidota bacterium]
MYHRNFFLLIITVLTFSGCATLRPSFDVNEALTYCSSQVNRTLKQLSPPDYTLMPRSIDDSSNTWKCYKVSREEWCSGFWPGILWYDYEYTGDTAILNQARNYNASLDFLSDSPAFDHDLGFLMYCSYGNGYRLTRDTTYKKILLKSATILSTLFNPKVGTILSWPREVEKNGWPHNTIMDNMINLELLFWASKNGGNPALAQMAVSHADKTMENQFRSDYTSYHVAVYDTITGKFIKGVTHQGYSDSSVWARGQAWAIYGFTMVYRETGNPNYLDFAQKIADVYLKLLPADYIPYWDFNDPAIPNAPKDASAAAVTASALLELSTMVHQPAQSKKYRDAAVHMLKSLSSPTYRSGSSKPSFLMHSTGNMPKHAEVDVSLIYADYYYMEALLRYKRMLEH